MSSMRRVAMLYSRQRWLPAKFYVDSRDAVDDGSGKVLSVADRINGLSFAADTSANRPTINTAFLGGTKLIHITATAGAQNLQHSGANDFGGDDQPVSFVCRVYRLTTQGRSFMTTHVSTSPPTLADGETMLRALSTTGIQVNRTTAASSSNNYNSTTTLSNNTWYTVGMSFSGSSIRVFKNGVFVQAHTSNLATVGSHTMITLGNRSSLADSMQGYYAAWKGWAASISDAQHLYEHNQLAAWAA